jgi:ferredoxin-type protein NapF
VHDSLGLPTVDFARGECTFCGACAEVCPEPVFDRAALTAWAVQAQVGDRCLAQRGIVCQSCRDACPVGAISFRPMLGRVAVPEIGLDACTGCGACVAPCPVAAIKVATPAVPHAG